MTDNFDKFKAFDNFSKITNVKISSPSDAFKVQLACLDFFQKVHDNAFEAGYQACLDSKIPK